MRASGDLEPSRRVLLVGFAPEELDLSHAPIDLQTLRSRIETGNAEVLAAGYDAEFLEIPLQPEPALNLVRARLLSDHWAAVMIGAGIRTLPEHTVLFEEIVNDIHRWSPSAQLAFNAGPDSTLDALRRVLE